MRRVHATPPARAATWIGAGLLAACAPASPSPPAPPPAASAALPAAAPAGPAAGALDEGEHHVVVNGVRLWYRVAGNGSAATPPVVFLHGGPGYNSHSFAAIAGPLLEPALRMVYLDQRGSGRSERPWTRDYALATLVEDVEGLRRALGVPRIALVGHSFGGTLALEYAARHPERVSRLIFVSGLWDAPRQCRLRRERVERLHPEAAARVLADSEGAAAVARSDCELEWRALQGAEREAYDHAAMFPDSARRRLQDSVDAASGLRNTGELGGALVTAGLLQYRFTAHDRLTMPVLVIAGGRDGAAGGEPQRLLARMLPDATFMELANGGHFPYLEEPDRFARSVIAFLGAR